MALSDKKMQLKQLLELVESSKASLFALFVALLSVWLMDSLDGFREFEKMERSLESELKWHINRMEEIGKLQQEPIDRFNPVTSHERLQVLFPIPYLAWDQAILSGQMMKLPEKTLEALYRHYENVKGLNNDVNEELKHPWGDFFREKDKVKEMGDHARKTLNLMPNSLLKRIYYFLR